MTSQRGATLAVGLVLLTLVMLLALAGANAAHVERLLAQDQGFRDNAANAASAGIEMAMQAIVNSSNPATTPTRLAAALPGSDDRFEVELRFAGFEAALPQSPGAGLVGAHFDIRSTGYSARGARDRQRVAAMRVVEDPAAAGADCEPLVPVRCHVRGELERLSWQQSE